MSVLVCLCIGIFGWCYVFWRGDFYFEGLCQKDELCFVLWVVNSIEINGIFYVLQMFECFCGWVEDIFEDFVFSVKVLCYIIYVWCLCEIDELLVNFFVFGFFVLCQCFGLFFWQFLLSMCFDCELFVDFFVCLLCDGVVVQKFVWYSVVCLYCEGYFDGDLVQCLWYVVEICYESFVDLMFIELLCEYWVVLVVVDIVGKWLLFGDVCVDFFYLCLYGDKEFYCSGYLEVVLGQWQVWICVWVGGGQVDDLCWVSQDVLVMVMVCDLYCYFDNDVKVCVFYDVWCFLQLLEFDGGLCMVFGQLFDDLWESVV